MSFFTPIKSFGFGVVAPLIVIGGYSIFAEPATVVEPIQVSEALKKNGYTEQTLQHMLIDTLSDLRTKAQGVTPDTTDTEQVLSKFNLPEFSVPGTGISVRLLVEYARTLLKFDSSVYGSVTSSPAGFSVALTLRDPHGETIAIHRTTASKEVSAHRTSEKPTDAPVETSDLEEELRQAAMEMLKHQSALLYAHYLLDMQQRECFSEKAHCDFREVRERYDQIAAGGGDESHRPKGNAGWAKLTSLLPKLHIFAKDNEDASAKGEAPWAELMLSKLDSLTKDYEGAIKHASRVHEQSKKDKSWEKALPWAYYNWGVALNDLGCYQAGAELLTQAVNKNTSYAPAYNALARSYIALAEASGRAESKPASLTDYRTKALAAARAALKYNPGYQEAYVNLGDALRLPVAASASGNPNADHDTDAKSAREAYVTAIALNVETAGRARQQLALMSGNSFSGTAERFTKRPECRADIPRSFLEASGCSDAQIRGAARASHKSELVSTGLTAGRKAANVCSNPELRLRDTSLRDTSPAEKPEGERGQITSIEPDAAAASRLHESPISGSLQKVAVPAERDPA